jgi:hypothetical protein
LGDPHGISNFYYVISFQNKQAFDRCQKEISEIIDSEREQYMIDMETASLRHHGLKCAVQSIVFSAMCLEAFIYGYSVKNLGKSYTNMHIERLGIESKFILVPRLVTGKEIDKSGQAYEGLKRLVKDRNKIVHFKGVNDFLSEDSFLPEAMNNGLNTISNLMDELIKIHPEEKIYFMGVPVYAECFA